MAEEDLLKAWAVGKHVNLNDKAVTGQTQDLITLYNESKNLAEFDINKEDAELTLFRASMYLLYRKFYAQLHKRVGKKGTTIGNKMAIWSAKEETEASEKGKTTKGATIKKKVVPLDKNEDTVNVFSTHYAKLLAKGFFPVGFLSKLFVFTEGEGGATMRAKIATVNGVKEIQFVRKIAPGIDYIVAK